VRLEKEDEINIMNYLFSWNVLPVKLRVR